MTFNSHTQTMSRLESSTEDQKFDLSELESMARISVSLPRNLYRQFRLHALEQDTTLSALMAKLIRQEIRIKAKVSGQANSDS
ncbi:MAG: hypothetical protein KFB97_07940 [Cyanobium sp. M30B3]|nr:MAG: hypothetical protein KFB97_07940 [Cyanobium sp. M30B3]